MIERARIEGTAAGSALEVLYDRVFDYFAGELFDKAKERVQGFLLKTAFLPILNAPLAGKLAGIGDAGRILSKLNRYNFFTERLSGAGEDYQYHPLFRSFLLNRAKSRLAPEELTVIQREAAALLEQSGQIEDAARLYGDAGDWYGLTKLTITHAQEFLMQGRNNTIAEWIAGIPVEMAENIPWLLYWKGMCSFPFDMSRAREYLEKAFASFKSINDATGLYLSWAGIVDTYDDEWGRLDNCIAVFDDLRKTHPAFPSREIDLIASSRMLLSLIVRKMDQPQLIDEWLARVNALMQEGPSFAVKLETIFFMNIHYLWKGEFHKNALLLERAEAEILHRKPSPFFIIRLKLMQGCHYWITAQYDAALHALSEGLDISDKSGVHMYNSMLWSFMAAAEMASGNLEMAKNHCKTRWLLLLIWRIH